MEPVPEAPRVEGGGEIKLTLADVADLSRSGTAEQVRSVLLRLVALPPGQEKMDLVRALNVGARRELHPWLLEVFAGSDDVEVSRELKQQLAAKATPELIAVAIGVHDAGADATAQSRVLEFLRECSGDESVEALADALLEPSRPVSEPVNAAIARALAANGSGVAVDALLLRLSGAGDAEAKFLADLLKGVTRPEAQGQLIRAAEGNKMASTVESRVASIQALGNYPTLETLAVMQRLSADPDVRIQRASGQVAGICRRVLKL